jgi:hypothetical protein
MIQIIIPGFGEKATELSSLIASSGVQSYVCAFYDMKPIRDLEVDYELIREYFDNKQVDAIIGNSLGTGLAHKLAAHIESNLVLLCPVLLQNSFWVNTIVKSRRTGVFLLRTGRFFSNILTGIGWKQGQVLRKSIDLFGPNGMWMAWRFFMTAGKEVSWSVKAEVFVCPNDFLVDSDVVKKRAQKLNWEVEELPCQHHRALRTYLAR